MPDNIVEEESEYDHDFEAERVCNNCDEIEEDCECELDDQDFEDSDACVICGSNEEDPAHQEES